MSQVEQRILHVQDQMYAKLRELGFEAHDDQFTAWEKDFIEARVVVRRIRVMNLTQALEDLKWTRGEKHFIFDMGKDGKIMLQHDLHVAWIYLPCPLKAVSKEAGREVKEKELIAFLEQWAHGSVAWDLSKKLKHKKQTFQSAKEAGYDAQFDYLNQRWRELNAAKFEGKMKAPIFHFTSGSRQHGVWIPQKQSMGLNAKIFNSDSKHFDELLLHEMCHQAVTEIDKSHANEDGSKGHGKLWQDWMKRVGQDPRRYANNEEDLRLHGHGDKYMEAVKGLKEADDADPGDHLLYFHPKKGEWVEIKVCWFRGDGMTAMDKRGSIWKFRNISQNKFYIPKKKDDDKTWQMMFENYMKHKGKM